MRRLSSHSSWSNTTMSNSIKGQRRKPGHCWCCATDALVRPRSYWTGGEARLLCAECEKDQSNMLNKLAPKPSEVKP